MKKVMQTWLGGIDAAVDGYGNCFQACVASILEIPLEEAFNHGELKDSEWFEQFNEWLIQYGLACIFVELNEPLHVLPIRGIHIAEVKTKSGLMHAVVTSNNIVVHDPMPNLNNENLKYNCSGMYLFVPLNPIIHRSNKKKIIKNKGGNHGFTNRYKANVNSMGSG